LEDYEKSKFSEVQIIKILSEQIKAKQGIRSAGNTVSASRHFTNGRVNMADRMFSNSPNEGT